jgi:hypothetical protein
LFFFCRFLCCSVTGGGKTRGCLFVVGVRREGDPNEKTVPSAAFAAAFLTAASCFFFSAALAAFFAAFCFFLSAAAADLL